MRLYYGFVFQVFGIFLCSNWLYYYVTISAAYICTLCFLGVSSLYILVISQAWLSVLLWSVCAVQFLYAYMSYSKSNFDNGWYMHTWIKEVIDLSDAFFFKICYKHRLQAAADEHRERMNFQWLLCFLWCSVVSGRKTRRIGRKVWSGCACRGEE